MSDVTEALINTFPPRAATCIREQRKRITKLETMLAKSDSELRNQAVHIRQLKIQLAEARSQVIYYRETKR